ncbi:hypothetical protein [Vreelandella sp. TE19]
MQHLKKCAQCGQEYDPSEARGEPDKPENCDDCGAELQHKHKHRHSEFLVDDAESDDGGEHGLEKTLREASHKADTD